ncbi:MAG: penicillin-binding transpeptidase domain-containing protein, partial [Opitutaceae bacterium]
SDPIGLPAEQYQALVNAMERVVGPDGTGKLCMIDGLRIAGKTGTAQQRSNKGTIEFAWFIGFAPVEHPEVAFAVLIEGDTPDESYGGGLYASPVAKYMLQKWLEKRNARNSATPVIPQPAQP